MQWGETWFVVRSPGEDRWRVFMGRWRPVSSVAAGPLMVDFERGLPLQIHAPTKHSLLRLPTDSEAPLLKDSPAPSWDFSTYASAVEAAQRRFQEGTLQKVVLSVRWRYRAGASNGWFYWAERMAERHPEAMVWLARLEDGTVWGGATPEPLLATDARQRWFTVALAGTADAPHALTAKERAEQASVAHHIQATLDAARVAYHLSDVRPIRTGHLWHLQTRFILDRPTVNPIELALRLHPTPAVTGAPQRAAFDFIRRHEPHARRFYTGIVGIADPRRPQLYVNLRCFHWDPATHTVDFYTGAGLTPDSDPAAEWREMQRKLAIIHYPWLLPT